MKRLIVDGKIPDGAILIPAEKIEMTPELAEAIAKLARVRDMSEESVTALVEGVMQWQVPPRCRDCSRE